VKSIENRVGKKIISIIKIIFKVFIIIFTVLFIICFLIWFYFSILWIQEYKENLSYIKPVYQELQQKYNGKLSLPRIWRIGSYYYSFDYGGGASLDANFRDSIDIIDSISTYIESNKVFSPHYELDIEWPKESNRSKDPKKYYGIRYTVEEEWTEAEVGIHGKMDLNYFDDLKKLDHLKDIYIDKSQYSESEINFIKEWCKNNNVRYFEYGN
jgi:hypothetical protein